MTLLKTRIRRKYTSLRYLCFLFLSSLYPSLAQTPKIYLKNQDSLSNYSNWNALEKAAQRNTQKRYLQGHFGEAQLEKINDTTYQLRHTKAPHYRHICIKTPSDSLLPSEIYTETAQLQKPILIQETPKRLQRISEKLSSLGYTFNKVNLTEISVQNAQLEAQLNIDLGNQRRIDSLVLVGYPKAPQLLLKKVLKLKKGQLLDLNQLQQHFENLKRIAFINTRKAPEILFNDDKTSLYIYLKKKPSNSLDGLLGVTNNEDDSRLQVNGFLEVSLVNNLNFGESLHLHYRKDNATQESFDIESDFKYLFVTPLALHIDLHILNIEAQINTSETNLMLGYLFDLEHRISVGRQVYSLSEVDQNSYTAQFGRLQYLYQKKHSNAPEKDLSIQLDYSLGKRDDTNSTQQRIGIQFEKILPVSLRSYLSLKSDHAVFISDNYQEAELYRFGGIHSIRGFNENSLVGSRYHLIRSEINYELNDQLTAHSITDFGITENAILNTSDRLYSIGLGLKMRRAQKLFQLNYSLGKANDDTFLFRNAKIQLSLRSVF